MPKKKDRTQSGTHALQALEDAGVAYELIEYEHSEHQDRGYALDTAKVLERDPATIFKTLMALVDGKPTCAVTIQLDEFDDRTRTFISNLLFDFLQITFQNAEQFRKQPYGNIPTPLSSDFCKDLGQDVFKSFHGHASFC